MRKNCGNLSTQKKKPSFTSPETKPRQTNVPQSDTCRALIISRQWPSLHTATPPMGPVLAPKAVAGTGPQFYGVRTPHAPTPTLKQAPTAGAQARNGLEEGNRGREGVWEPKGRVPKVAHLNNSVCKCHVFPLRNLGPGRAGGGWVGTRPWWLALVGCGGAYWPLALEPSAMTSRHP